MQTVIGTAGALVVDSLPYSMGGTAKMATDLAKAGVKCLVGYLGVINLARVKYLHDAGVGFMPVTLGTTIEHWDGQKVIAECEKLGLSSGCSVWLDMEGLKIFHTEPHLLMDKANAWGVDVKAGGQMDCLYVGVPQPLTGPELYSLHQVRYWHGQGEVRDRTNAFADPHPVGDKTKGGWCMRQKYPSVVRGGVLVDDNVLTPDAQGRLPSWTVG